jgi:ribosomal protein L44E
MCRPDCGIERRRRASYGKDIRMDEEQKDDEEQENTVKVEMHLTCKSCGNIITIHVEEIV